MSVRCSGGVHRRRWKVGERSACARKSGRGGLGLAARLGLSLALATGAQGVRAQDAQGTAADTPPTAAESGLPTAAVLTTTGDAEGDAGLDSVIHASLEKLGVVKITAKPGMDLGAIQLAIDCVGETPQCMRAVASQSGVQILVAPAIERGGAELVLTLLYFDARGEGELRRVARRQSGAELKPETLDAVPSMLRELFQIAAPAEAPAPGEGGPEAPPPRRGVPVGPLILGGACVAIVGVGIAFGLMMQSTQDTYSTLKVKNTPVSLSNANDKASAGKTYATVANVLFGVGAAAIAAGGVWLALELTKGSEAEGATQTALLPWAGPGQLGLALVHRGGKR